MTDNIIDLDRAKLQAAARALEQRIQPGDRVALFVDGVTYECVIVGPSPVWWRALLPDGRTYDFDVHNDPSWIEPSG
jgi:hypothetical protein